MSEPTFGESIYAVGVAVGEDEEVEVTEEREPSPTAAPARQEPVLYCDICRRWGTAETAHTCWRNWRVRLSDLLLDLASDVRRHPPQL